jgi:TolB-like protein/Flp pilus assembly protein TadD
MNARLNGFFCELRRRKVYRTAGGYAVFGWLLIQIAATIFPALELPTWTLRGVILAVLAGFPVVLILAWAFDIGPHGFERTAPIEAAAEECPPALKPRRRNIYLLAGLGALVAIAAGFILLPRLSRANLDKSIAVLPFDNFSEDKDNEHFADGIQDDLLTSLAKIGDLKVISRTSVLPYKGKAHNMKEIGRALGVSALLEGSVRRDGDRVRVNVQLINAANDQHLWAEVYERDLTDVFTIQSALAQEIAVQLKAKLSPDEKARVDTRPTQNGDAYLLYVQAQAIATGPDTEERKKAEALFERAIELDPHFALAYARLSWLQSWLYFSIDPAPARLEKARAAANEAIRLQPDLPECHVALGFTYYYGDRDYERALKEFAVAQRALPNDAGIYRAIGAIERRQAKWKESTANYRRAVSLNPRDAVLLRNLALNYLGARDYPTAAKTLDRSVSLAPADFEIKALRAWVDVYADGDFTRFDKLLAAAPPEADASPVEALARYNVLFFERKYDEALAALAKTRFENMRGETSAPLPKSFLAAQVHRAKGDLEPARIAYEQALPVAERAVADSPNDPSRHALLGLIYGGLGRNAEAVAEGSRAQEILPETKDAFNGPLYTISLARIHTLVDNHDQAVELLERSLSTPNGITAHELRLEPTWDPLRQNARFQKLVAEAKSGSR